MTNFKKSYLNFKYLIFTYNKVVKVVVIPVFNEEKSIFNIINKVFNHCDKIIVVNDSSTDGTKEILESINNENLIIMTNEKNLGIGGATKVGIKKALEIDAKIIIKFDGDGQHSSNDIPKFLNMIENENYDFVKGNRFKSSISEMPAVKILGNLFLQIYKKLFQEILEYQIQIMDLLLLRQVFSIVFNSKI